MTRAQYRKIGAVPTGGVWRRLHKKEGEATYITVEPESGNLRVTGLDNMPNNTTPYIGDRSWWPVVKVGETVIMKGGGA